MATVNVERVHKRSASPQDLQRRKRQKTETSASRPSAADLALDHLLHDSDDSPLRQQDFDLLLESVCPQSSLDSLIHDPLTELMRRVDTKASSEKVAALRNELLQAWTRRIMQATGDSLSEVTNLSKPRAAMTFELNGARMELRFMPVLEIKDTDAAVSAADERENTAGIEELSIQGREEESDESSETETDSTVSTETRKRQREMNTGGSMAHFYNKPSRLQTRDFHLLERGYTMREIYGSLLVTSSQERDLEPPKRMNKPEHIEVAPVAEESDSDDDGSDEEDEHARPLVQGSDSMRESTVGDEPMSPDASGEEPETADYPVVAQRSSVRTSRFPSAASVQTSLVLIKKNYKSGPGHPTVTRKDIIAALSAAGPAIPTPPLKLIDEKYWHISYSTADAASRALATPLELCGETVMLLPLREQSARTFMSTNAPTLLDVGATVAELHDAFPSVRLYIGRCRNTKKGMADVFVVIFEKQGNMSDFQLGTRLLDGNAYTLRFKARSDEVKCYACKKLHPMAECEQLSAVQTLRSHNRLLAIPPIIRPE
ncbi:hypothetical protein LTR27_011245 [Elasticomyces elasticus]|nr:hypothetical protein LTR27_011245 [Elasticomyces elasticus]